MSSKCQEGVNKLARKRQCFFKAIIQILLFRVSVKERDERKSKKEYENIDFFFFIKIVIVF